MSEPAHYPSKTRVIRDDVLVYAEGQDIPITDPDELVAQGHLTREEADALPVVAPPAGLVTGLGIDPDTLAVHPSKERVVRDDVLVYAEGDEIAATDLDELARQGYIDGPVVPDGEHDASGAEAKKAPAKKAAARKRA